MSLPKRLVSELCSICAVFAFYVTIDLEKQAQ